MIPMVYIGLIMAKLDMLNGANLIIYILLMGLLVVKGFLRVCLDLYFDDRI